MPHTASTVVRPMDVITALWRRPLRWGVPTIVCTIAALLVAVFVAPTWEASQALIVRDEASGSLTHPGKFSHVEEMKTVQETILELSKSRGVLTQALAQIGPPTGSADDAQWPTDKAIEALQDAVKLSPPKGAEFGKTEVFYLKVQQPDHDRAVALASTIAGQLQSRFEALRESRAQSVIVELTKTVAMAQSDLDNSTQSLAELENHAGGDLAELRLLNETPSGDSHLGHAALDLEKELRTFRAEQSANQEMLDLLRGAQEDPGRLLASPNLLLKSQPALRRLKDGLVDAQIRTAQLLGTMSETHPKVIAAKTAEREIGEHLHNELAIAIKGLEVNQHLTNERVAALEEQHDDFQARLGRLANVRAEYSNLLTTTRHRGEILKTAQTELSEARANLAAAHTSSLISLIDSPDAGTKPIGLGRAAMVLAGLMAGLAIGLGFAFFTVQPTTSTAPHAAETAAFAVDSTMAGVARQLDKFRGLSVKRALRKLTGRPVEYR